MPPSDGSDGARLAGDPAPPPRPAATPPVRAADVVADLLICENTVGRLPPRYRLLWLVLALAVVALLGLAARLL